MQDDKLIERQPERILYQSVGDTIVCKKPFGPPYVCMWDLNPIPEGTEIAVPRTAHLRWVDETKGEEVITSFREYYGTKPGEILTRKGVPTNFRFVGYENEYCGYCCSLACVKAILNTHRGIHHPYKRNFAHFLHKHLPDAEQAGFHLAQIPQAPDPQIIMYKGLDWFRETVKKSEVDLYKFSILPPKVVTHFELERQKAITLATRHNIRNDEERSASLQGQVPTAGMAMDTDSGMSSSGSGTLIMQLLQAKQALETTSTPNIASLASTKKRSGSKKQ